MPDAIDLVASWAGQPVTAVPIKGGLSHRIARVEAEDGRRWLLRVLDPAVSAAGLGIPIDQEIANTVRAARAGVGARIVHLWPEAGALLLEYIDGVTLDAKGVADDIEGVAKACRTLHAGPRFVNDFSIFDKLRQFIAICREHDLPMPPGFKDVLPAVADIERAMPAVPAVPCHNDLLPENFITTPSGVRIVDYQLSGNNDPAFELGDIAAEADFDPDQTARLARAYGIDVARVRLFAIMSNVTWTLWFSVHSGLLTTRADFDYEAEAADKLAQAVRALDDPAFGRLIDAVRKPPR
ncbi:choline/ethanolamine kinase family protein [Thermoactinospora rubra]|uniref:choline/ethanolamine kinase family protein n=1 Tax=Thermoactinospora rubra TaxID=1088767 RepID=UPI000A11B16E|nr:choline/ethanolamine kinase family protein [Thermoactinospora rubra]